MITLIELLIAWIAASILFALFWIKYKKGVVKMKVQPTERIVFKIHWFYGPKNEKIGSPSHEKIKAMALHYGKINECDIADFKGKLL